MADINTVTIIGRLVRDEELSYTAGGMAVGKISLAINRSVKRDGEWQNEPNFFDVTIFGKQAEGLKQYLTKGKQIGVTGFLKQDRWTDPQGQSRTKISIIANDIQLLGGKDSANSQSYENDNEAPADYGYGN